ncbi:MAG: CHAP domain-containing protein [Verrucomicrobiia bacterium]
MPVYHNGPDIVTSHGRHFAPCGYYYGQKWQCVEFIKRFYFDALGHAFPDVMGHAKDFFDPSVPHGQINHRRALLQFRNGYGVRPQPDDLLVFTEGTYGHVAIISHVGSRHIEIVQQNILGQPRAILPLARHGSTWHVGQHHPPAGWLRVPGRWVTLD